jgi:hypothetical protein
LQTVIDGLSVLTSQSESAAVAQKARALTLNEMRRPVKNVRLTTLTLVAILASSLTVITGQSAAVASSPSVTWAVSNSPSQYWIAISSSDDGTHLAAIGDYIVYRSANGGLDWTATNYPDDTDGNPIASDATGSIVYIASRGSIYKSVNYGADFSITGSDNLTDTYWTAISCSGDGQYVFATDDNKRIYRSSDGGATWSHYSYAVVSYWSAITSSKDGQYVFATDQGGVIYRSNQYGDPRTFTTSESGTFGWRTIASSSDGKNVVASNGDFLSWRSTDYGAHWMDPTVGADFVRKIASSSDGSRLVAVADNNNIYVSDDSGATWTAQFTSGSDLALEGWRGVTLSGDGTKIVATPDDGAAHILLGSWPKANGGGGGGDGGAAARAKAQADAAAAAAAKAQQDHDTALALGTLALAIGTVESGLSTLTLAATKGVHPQTAPSKKKSKKVKKLKPKG